MPASRARVSTRQPSPGCAVQRGESARDALVLQRREETLELRRPLHVMTQHQHEHGFSEAVEHALPAGGLRFVLDEHQPRERVQLGRGAPVFAAHHDHRWQRLQNRVRPARFELHLRAEHRRERTVAARAGPRARLALRRARELVPIGMREHHQVAAAHHEGLALAFVVQPRLSASDEVKDGAGRAGGIERPGTAVAALLEDPRAQAKRLQDVR